MKNFGAKIPLIPLAIFYSVFKNGTVSNFLFEKFIFDRFLIGKLDFRI
jgi:hypothetical protein